MLKHFQVGPLPPDPLDGSNDRKRFAGRYVHSLNSPKAKGYRERQAVILLRKIGAGEICGTAAKAVEKDYRHEFKKLRAVREGRNTITPA